MSAMQKKVEDVSAVLRLFIFIKVYTIDRKSGLTEGYDEGSMTNPCGEGDVKGLICFARGHIYIMVFVRCVPFLNHLFI